jgi:hypothetical protein
MKDRADVRIGVGDNIPDLVLIRLTEDHQIAAVKQGLHTAAIDDRIESLPTRLDWSEK